MQCWVEAANKKAALQVEKSECQGSVNREVLLVPKVSWVLAQLANPR
jgi:hypothetical protein